MPDERKPLNFPAKATIIDLQPQSMTIRLQLLPVNDVQSRGLQNILLNVGALKIVRTVPVGALSLDVQILTNAKPVEQPAPAAPAHVTLSADDQAKASAPEAMSHDTQAPESQPIKTAPVVAPQEVKAADKPLDTKIVQ